MQGDLEACLRNNSSNSNGSSGQHVLYCMRTAVRGHENPALDVARAAARQLDLPLVVAAFLLRSHTYPTARRYTFWMQGLRDTQTELRQQVNSSTSRKGVADHTPSLHDMSNIAMPVTVV